MAAPAAPVDFPCPDVICGIPKIIIGGGGDILGGVLGGLGSVLPSISDIVASVISAIVKSFTGSAKDNLKLVIQGVVSTPVADLRAKAFQAEYGNLFGLVLLLGILGVVFGMLRNLMQRHQGKSVLTPPIGYVKMLFGASILPGIITLVIMFGQLLSKALLKLFENTHWQDNVQSFPSAGNTMTDLFLTVNTWIMRLVILMEISPIELSVAFFTVLGLFTLVSFVLKDDLGVVGRWILSAILTGATLQLMLVGILTIGGTMIGSIHQSAVSQDAAIFVLLLLCIFFPILVFFGWNKRIKTWVENRNQRMSGDVRITDDMSRGKQTADVQRGIDAKVANFNQQSSGSGGGSLVKDAALVGTGAAVDHVATRAAVAASKAGGPIGTAAGLGISYVHHRKVKPKFKPKSQQGPNGGGPGR